MEFLEVDIAPPLINLVHNITIYEDYTCPSQYELLMPSIYPQLIINLDGNAISYTSGVIESIGSLSTIKNAWFTGVFIKPLFYSPIPRAGAACIQLKPQALNLLWKVNPSELINQLIPADLILGNKVKNLREHILETESLELKGEVIVDFLLQEKRSSEDRESISSYIISQIVNGKSLSDIYSEMCFSAKHTIKRFKEEIGIRPKRFQNLMRVTHTMPALFNLNQRSTAQIAVEHGFYDQSHFIQTFKTFCEITPQEYINSVKPYYHVLYVN